MARTGVTNSEEMLTVADVANRLNVSATTVYRLVYAFRLEVVRVGRSLRVAPSALEKFKSEQTQGSLPPLKLRF